MTFINQYSYGIFALAAVILLGFFLFRKGVQGSDFIAIGALILGFLLAFLFLRPGRSTTDDAETVLEQIGSGQAVLLQFQSNY
jgi:hypothetical protein